MARRHALYHAAASCLLTWQANRAELGGAFAAGGWLVLCLERLLQRFFPGRELSSGHLADLEVSVLRAFEEGETFSFATLSGTHDLCVR